jgi:hypothetical protein
MSDLDTEGSLAQTLKELKVLEDELAELRAKRLKNKILLWSKDRSGIFADKTFDVLIEHISRLEDRIRFLEER